MDPGMNAFSGLLGFVALVVAVWCYVRILRRAGYAVWWLILMFVPLVNIVMVWIFAFAEWPALARARGGGSAARIQGNEYVPGGTLVDRAPRGGPGAAPEPAGEAAGWMLSGFDGDGHAVRLEFSAADMENADGLVVGRSPQQSDLVIADTSVSRRHARLVARGGRLEIEDLGSANGTLVGGRALAAGERAELAEGTDLVFGETRLRLTAV